MNKLSEVVFTKVGDTYKAIGIYKVIGTVMQGESFDPVLETLAEGDSYYLVRREAKKLAYASVVPFCDVVTARESMQIAIKRRAI
jgi:hypothetical protein